MYATSKQLMDNSKLFRIAFWGAIVSMCVGTVLCSVFPFTACPSDNTQPCWHYFSSYTFQCYKDRAYCCTAAYMYCGNVSFCIYKPDNYSDCTGLLIVGATLLGIAGVLTVFVIVMFCNFKSRFRKGAYVNSTNDSHQQGYIQPIYANNYPQRNTGMPVNLSESQ